MENEDVGHRQSYIQFCLKQQQRSRVLHFKKTLLQLKYCKEIQIIFVHTFTTHFIRNIFIRNLDIVCIVVYDVDNLNYCFILFKFYEEY